MNANDKELDNIHILKEIKEDLFKKRMNLSKLFALVVLILMLLINHYYISPTLEIICKNIYDFYHDSFTLIYKIIELTEYLFS